VGCDPFQINCYGSRVIFSGAVAPLGKQVNEGDSTRPPSPALHAGSGNRAGDVRKPWKTALIFQHWSHAFLTDKNWQLHPDVPPTGARSAPPPVTTTPGGTPRSTASSVGPAGDAQLGDAGQAIDELGALGRLRVRRDVGLQLTRSAVFRSCGRMKDIDDR
jgi:hypothetical protein